MSFRIQLRRDTSANWTSINPVLMEAEFGYETDTGMAKIGDGVTNYSSLPYWPGSDTIDLYGPTGSFQSGATGMGITGANVSTEIVSGVPYYRILGSYTKNYCIRLEYDNLDRLSGDFTVLNNGNYTGTGVSVTTGGSSKPIATFNFSNESTPPSNIYGYFYNAIEDRYKISTFGLGSVDYIKTSPLDSDQSLPIVTNDFFTDFSNGNSNGYEIEIDMTASGYGGQKSPSNRIHAYVVFTF